MVALAIADEATIKSLDKYKQITAQLSDPRKLTDAQAKALIQTGKPIYWATGSLHSSETGSPEMLIELAYRLAVEETPFIREIRNNAIVVITPVSEVDGHERQVDNRRAQDAGQPQPGMTYWGKYVAHDNNRDGIGKGLKLTQNMLKAFLDLHPQVMHDLHESVTLLYTSTGTGPYYPEVAPVQVTEWWWLAETEIMGMTKRGVPGVWTYNYYDGWVPNYMFWIAVTHNSIGKFYETQSYGGGRVAERRRPRRLALRRRVPRQRAAHGGGARAGAAAPAAAAAAGASRSRSSGAAGGARRRRRRTRHGRRPEPRVVSSLSGAARGRAVERPREHQHAGVGHPDRDERRGEEPRDVPRELLHQEQDDGGRGEDARAVRVRHSRRAASSRRSGRPDELLPARGG